MPWRLSNAVIRLYCGPTNSLNTDGITNGPFLKQMSSQKCAKSNLAPCSNTRSTHR